MSDNKLAQLIALCKCGVHLTVNEHRNVYETAEQWLVDQPSTDGIDSATWDAMVKSDAVICLQFYPDTPVGCFVIYGHDLSVVLDEALAAVTEKRRG